jgi:uncharacterized protein YegL
MALMAGAVSAQTPAPSVSSAVFAPEAVTCSAPFTSSLTLNGFNNEVPAFADFVLVVDESGSIDSAEWAQWDQFVDALIGSLLTPGSNNRVGMVKYSSVTRLVQPLTSDPSLLTSIPRTFPGGSTATAQAMSTASQHLASAARADAKKFMIVLTDGFCTCTTADITTQAQQAEMSGVTVIAVGVDQARESELEAIATNVPGVDTSIFVSDFAALQTALASLMQALVTPGATSVNVVLDAMPRFPVTGASASAGTVTVSGNQVVWTLPSLGAGSQTLSVSHQHDGAGDGPLQVFSATYSDAESHTVGIDIPSTIVSGCNKAPVANAGPDQTLSADGATTAVTLDASATTDDGLLQPIAYTWSIGSTSIATGVTTTVALPVGTHVVTVTANDGELSDTDTVVITINDTTAPVLTLTAPPPVHASGPSGATVAFTATATDAVDGARPVTCTAAGNPVASGATFPIGTTTVACTSSDTHGNAAQGSFAVAVTNTLPVATPASYTTTAGVTLTVAAPGVLAGAGDADGDPIIAVLVSAPANGALTLNANGGFTYVPAAGFTGNDSFAFRVNDGRQDGNTVTVSLTVAVGVTPGLMTGHGWVRDDDDRFDFQFVVRERANGSDWGRLEVRIKDEDRDRRGGKKKHPRQRDDRFESQRLTSVEFSDDPTIRPGRSRRPQIDTVRFEGIGAWNGQRNYRFVAVAQDMGEPGRHRESISITIFDPLGNVVASVGGDLDGGNIQSARIRH